MSNTKITDIKLNDGGIQAVLKGPAADVCRQRAQQIAGSLDGELYRYYDINAKKRGGGGVSTVGLHGMYSNRKHGTLLKALGKE